MKNYEKRKRLFVEETHFPHTIHLPKVRKEFPRTTLLPEQWHNG